MSDKADCADVWHCPSGMPCLLDVVPAPVDTVEVEANEVEAEEVEADEVEDVVVDVVTVVEVDVAVVKDTGRGAKLLHICYSLLELLSSLMRVVQRTSMETKCLNFNDQYNNNY